MLLAIVYAGREVGAELRQVVAAADFINHAILTYEEFARSVTLLQERGLVQSAAGSLRATRATLDAFPAGRTTVDADLKRVGKLLERSGEEPRIAAKWSVTKADFDSAVDAYVNA